MRALFIDSEKQVVTEFDFNNTLHVLADLIGNSCRFITAPVVLPNEDTFYCDDEGALYDFNGGFMMSDWQYPICGNCVIIGADEEGCNADAKSSVEDIQNKLIFLNREQLKKYDI